MNRASYHRYFIRLSYDGTHYHGWQQQRNASSVQEVLTSALKTLLGHNVSVVGCGRTDTGVHARDFYAHFDIEKELPQEHLQHLVYRLNRFLPQDIAVHRLREVPQDLHARFSAVSRTYRYYIHTRKDPFLSGTSWFVNDTPDMDIMNAGARMLMGYEDFTSFSKLHSDTKTNICHIKEAEWTQEGHRMIFTITADRFLRNMVRAIVGTLVELGQEKVSLEDLRRIIEARDRSDAGQSVPAHALFLERVAYSNLKEV